MASFCQYDHQNNHESSVFVKARTFLTILKTINILRLCLGVRYFNCLVSWLQNRIDFHILLLIKLKTMIYY
jgi:hypothetical protein